MGDMIQPIPKPGKRPKNQGQKQWISFRRNFLKSRANWDGRYMCEHCHGLFESIDVDHITMRSGDIGLKFDPENLRLLCRRCHQIRHNQRTV